MLAGAALAGAAALVWAAAASSSPAKPQADVSLQSQLVRSINAFRRAYGLPAVRACGPLTAAAREHDADMLTNGYFSHDSFDGTSFASRILHRFQARAVGENLLWVTGSTTADSILASWVASPGHRANLLDPRWRHVGVSATDFAASPGVYADAAGVVITADFAAGR